MADNLIARVTWSNW